MAGFESLLIKMAITFALRQLQAFGDKTDWVLVKEDCFARIKQLVPNAVADIVLDAMFGGFIDALALACKEPAVLDTIVSLMMAGKINQAIGLVEDLVTGQNAA